MLVVGAESYPVKRQDLPTVVECFKTYDDTNLIKSADVGQVHRTPLEQCRSLKALVVFVRSDHASIIPRLSNPRLQVIVIPERGTELPDGIEARNGVTPPMRDTRKRRFRKLRDINPAFMRQVEEAVLLIASVSLWPPSDNHSRHG